VALNIADLAEHAIDAVPDRVALICGDEQVTYAQLEDKANRLAHYLIERGVKKDDKVGLYCRNRIEIVIAMLGIVKAAPSWSTSTTATSRASSTTCSTTPT
jgi:acyl-CoA synthetase (AMP-forming)/AMP-acid ligase II